MTDFEPTLVPYIIFSDSVIRETGTNKLSFIGTFQVFYAKSFPLHAPLFFVTPKITNLSGKLEKVKLTARIEEPDSGVVVSNAGAEVNSQQEVPRDADIEIPLPMGGVVFQHAGSYHVTVLLNNEVIGKRLLQVISITGNQQLQIKEGQ
jgi:hypothetical protein